MIQDDFEAMLADRAEQLDAERTQKMAVVQAAQLRRDQAVTAGADALAEAFDQSAASNSLAPETTIADDAGDDLLRRMLEGDQP